MPRTRPCERERALGMNPRLFDAVYPIDLANPKLGRDPQQPARLQ